MSARDVLGEIEQRAAVRREFSHRDDCVACNDDMPCRTVRKITEALGGGA